MTNIHHVYTYFSFRIESCSILIYMNTHKFYPVFCEVSLSWTNWINGGVCICESQERKIKFKKRCRIHQNKGRSDDYGDEDDINDDKSINEEGVEDTGNKSGRTEYKEEEHPGMHVAHGCHFIEGKMKHGMEDYVVATQKKVGGFEVGLYAIFDGHSGRDVAEYLQSHLFDNILNEPDFWTNPKSAVKRAYKVTDNDILENLVGPEGGSTAATAILINREKLVMANVGDSRAVLCKNGKPNQITEDHDPLNEKELVERRGGFVSKMPGNVPRVDGQLSMTRAFGDERLKNRLTAEPHVVIEKIDEHTEFIILASDGLWKVICQTKKQLIVLVK